MSRAALTPTLAPTRKPINLSIDVELLRVARAHGINLSAFLEQALVVELKQLRRMRWLAENGAAISAYNADVRRHSAFRDRICQVGEGRYVVMTPMLAGIPTRELGAPVADLSSYGPSIIAAIELLVKGL